MDYALDDLTSSVADPVGNQVHQESAETAAVTAADDLASSLDERTDQAQPGRVTLDVDETLDDLTSSVDAHAASTRQAAQAMHTSPGSSDHVTSVIHPQNDTSQLSEHHDMHAVRTPLRLTADVNLTVDELSHLAVTHAAALERSVYDSGMTHASGAKEASASAAASAVDVPLEDSYQADAFEAVEEAEMAAVAAAAGEADMAAIPDRPASPVAMQLASAEATAVATSGEEVRDRTAPASLAGDATSVDQILVGGNNTFIALLRKNMHSASSLYIYRTCGIC